MKKVFLLIVALVIITTAVNAQNGTVRGFIYNEKTGEAEIGATTFLKGTTMGAASDVNGFYSISKIPAGKYTLVVTSLGFDTVTFNISVGANEIVNQKVYLNQQAETEPQRLRPPPAIAV